MGGFSGREYRTRLTNEIQNNFGYNRNYIIKKERK
jgi:hypothetical protein